MKQVGFVVVDSGTLVIGDPCYLLPTEDETPVTYQSVIDAPTRPEVIPFARFTVLAQAFGGDGTYPVYAEYTSDGRLASLTIDFAGADSEIEDDADDAEEAEEATAGLEALGQAIDRRIAALDLPTPE